MFADSTPSRPSGKTVTPGLDELYAVELIVVVTSIGFSMLALERAPSTQVLTLIEICVPNCSRGINVYTLFDCVDS